MPTFEEQKRIQNLFRTYRSQGMDRKTARAKAEADALAASKPDFLPEGTVPGQERGTVPTEAEKATADAEARAEDPNSNIEENAAINASEPEYDDGYVEPTFSPGSIREVPIESTSDVKPRFSEVGEAASSDPDEELATGQTHEPNGALIYPGGIPPAETPEDEAALQEKWKEEGEELEEELAADRAAAEQKGQEEVQRKTEQYARELVEKSKDPSSLLYRSPKYRMHVKRLEEMLANLGSGRGISAEDSKWVQQYRAEVAAKEAKRLEDIRSGAGRYIDEDAATTDTAVANRFTAEDRAREAAGIPIKRKIHPPKAASDGRMLPMITHDPSLTRVIEVFDPPGSDNLVNRIVEDIPGARDALRSEKEGQGLVRMRFGREMSPDTPTSHNDHYVSRQMADRQIKSREDRIRETARRKKLLARNRLIKRGFRDSKNPLAYGKDAAAVRIAEIAAEAEKAKAEAEAKIKADDTLSDHEKQLAIIKATGEINANAAAAQNEFDAGENRENRQSAETVAGVEQEQTATALQQVEWERQRDALESELSNQQAILTDPTSSIEDMKIARGKIKNLREKLRILNNQILGDAATNPAQADDTQQFLDDGWEEVEEDEGDGGAAGQAAGQAVGGAGATNALSIKDATQYLTVSEPQLLAELNTDAMNEMFTEDNALSFDESDLMDLYVKLKEFFDSKKINSTNITAAGPYINSKLAAFHRATLLEFKGSTTEAEGDWFIDIPGTTRNDIYEFFEAIKNGNMPRGL